MSLFVQYPQPGPDQQTYLESQTKNAKYTISKYSCVNKVFDNFNIYDNKSYPDCNNIIYKACINPNPSSEQNLDKVVLLDKALECRNKFPWKHYTHFKNNITSCEYYKSKSAFYEIIIMYKIKQIVGDSNIEFESPLSGRGTNADVCVSLGRERKIYLEITSVTISDTANKLREIFFTTAKYLYSKIPKNSCLVSMQVDTTKLDCDSNGNIDEKCSKRMMRKQIDQSSFDQIYVAPLLLSAPNGQHLARISMSKICGDSSVHIQPYETHYVPPSPSDLAWFQKKADLDQIKRKITYKAKVQQYESGCPAILVIYWMPTIIEYEISEREFFEVKCNVVDCLKSYPELSGVFLFYSDDHSNGKFIYNPCANANARITESEVRMLFYHSAAE